MMPIKDLSISRRLTMINMVVSGIALLLACAALFAYDWVSFRESLVRRLSIQADVIGNNSVSALLFNDTKSAQETLGALRAASNITSAVIGTADGQPFATYVRDPDSGFTPSLPAIPRGRTDQYSFALNEITLVRMIMFAGKPTGVILIRSDLNELYSRSKRYLWIMCGVWLISLSGALLVSSRFTRAISEPIVHLAAVARTVSRDKDYSIRARTIEHRGEVSSLIAGFNEMLSQIQDRDKALEKSRDKLESHVEERTAQLAAANKELEAFSYSVSHDLRAPLRHIDGFASILADRFGPAMEPAAQRYLNLVREGAKQMGRLVDDLLSMGHISRQEMSRKSTDIYSLVRTVLKDLHVENHGSRIEWRIDHLPTVDCDPGLTGIVFTNLLSNAIKYSRHTEHPVIEVGHTSDNGVSTLFVKDNGAGFDQKYSEKLFGVFQRLHRSEDFEGTGVGLATVHRIVQRHGGRIWAQGEVGKGATFFFTLTS